MNMKVNEYRDSVTSDLTEVKSDLKVLIEINKRQDEHLLKLNGRVEENKDAIQNTKSEIKTIKTVWTVVVSFVTLGLNLLFRKGIG